MFRWFTAGESHGECLIGIIEGLPAGLPINKKTIDEQLMWRQVGFGRGARMKIENDSVQILSGIRKGITIGSPIALCIKNKDFSIDKLPSITNPRPGHADLAGYIKYNPTDIRSILERASARETAMRVALGSIAKTFLKKFGMEIFSHILEIGGISADVSKMRLVDIVRYTKKSPVRCASKEAEEKMIARIKKAMFTKDTLGGTFEVVALGVIAGLGSYVQWDRRIDARIAGAIMSIPGIKGVEIGLGFGMKGLPGSKVHDAIYYKKSIGYYRKTNNCGGIEGGITNGQPVIVKGIMKPIATLGNPLESVDVKTKKTTRAAVERSDVCAVPSAGIIAESMTALELCGMFVEKFGSDNMRDVTASYKRYLKDAG